MAIELIQKESSKKNLFLLIRKEQLLMVFIGIFVFVLLGYGGLLGYNSYLKGKIVTLDEQIEELMDKRDLGVESQVKAISRQVKDVRNALSNHVYWSNIFTILKDSALSRSYYSDFDGSIRNVGEGSVRMEVEVPGYLEAANQIKVFNDESRFTGVNIFGITAKEGIVSFTTEMSFDADLLLKK